MTEINEGARTPPASYEDLAKLVDFAVLTPNGSEEQMAAACDTAKKYRPGRLTVRPADLDLVMKWMERSGVMIGTTVDYPHGAGTTSSKLYAVRDALQRGAKAIETVLNPGKMLSRQFRYVESELMQMAQECHRTGAELIVDLEAGWLGEDLRVIACRIVKRAEVDRIRVRSLYGPEADGPEIIAFLTGKLGDWVKVESTAVDMQEALAAYEAGAAGFQTPDPIGVLESWSAELKRREAETAAS